MTIATQREPLEFLCAQPPFDRLSAFALRRVDETLEIAFAPQGSVLLARGGTPSRFLYVVRKGAVRLERDGRVVQELEEGDAFGFPSLLASAAPHVDVVAAEDSLLYMIPSEVFHQLTQEPGFAELFLADLNERLQRAAATDPLPLGVDLMAPVATVAAAPVVWVSPESTVQQAAEAMRASGAGAVLVGDGPPSDGRMVAAGIVTDRDLRNRVLAAGRGPQTPVHEVMSAPVRTLPAGASSLEALLFLLEHGCHHAPLDDGGRLVGVVSDRELLRQTVKSPLGLLHRIERSSDPQSLAGFVDELAGAVGALHWSGVHAVEIARVVSRLVDALVVRRLRVAEARLGSPPCAYAFAVFGSEGRGEQALVTDQDNALVYADEAAGAAEYFAALATTIAGDLAAAGFPPCAGGFTAQRWRHPLAHWQAIFRQWIDRPDPQALVEALNLLDLRPVHGTLELAPLRAIVQEAGRDARFLAHLARASLGMRPPLGAFRRLVEEEEGVDLKRGGIVPIVSLARLSALEVGSPAVPTLDRLGAARQAGRMSGALATDLAEGFRFLLEMRLGQQLDALRSGQRPSNKVRPEALSPLERRHLKDVFLVIREAQEATAVRLALERLA
jgi:CBS domain-containing protein